MANPKLSLEETLEDDLLQDAFLTFLRGRLMSVCFELWLEIARYESATSDEERRRVYKGIFKRFFEKGCPDPMSLPKPILLSITKYNAGVDNPNKILPINLFAVSKEELYMLLCWTCLPAFQLSDMYNDFQSGKIDSSKTKFSRSKAEQFFGHTFIGPLMRNEIVKFYAASNVASKGKQKKRLEQELNYQTVKKTQGGDRSRSYRRGGGNDQKKKFHPVYGEVTDSGEATNREEIPTNKEYEDLSLMNNWTLADPHGCRRCGLTIGGVLQCRKCGDIFCEPCRCLPPRVNGCGGKKIAHDFSSPNDMKESGSVVGLWDMFEVGEEVMVRK